MKKTLLLLSLFICAVSYAQVPSGFSFAAGLNSSSLKSDRLHADKAMGFTAGIAFNLGYNETFNYEVDVLYSRNSIKLPYHSTSELSAGSQKYNIDNLDFAVLFNYYILKPDEDKFYAGVQAGGYVSIAAAQWRTPKNDDITGQVYEGNLTNSDFDNVSEFNAGVCYGVVTGYNNFRLSLRYNMGLTNVLNGASVVDYSGDYSEDTNFKGKLSSIALTLYYKL